MFQLLCSSHCVRSIVLCDLVADRCALFQQDLSRAGRRHVFGRIDDPFCIVRETRSLSLAQDRKESTRHRVAVCAPLCAMAKRRHDGSGVGVGIVFLVGCLWMASATQAPVGFEDATFLPNWMSTLLPVLSNRKLLDLSFPGTHDTMTYDLSTTVSDDANDLPPAISWLLHEFHNFGDLGWFIRNLVRALACSVSTTR